MPDLISVAEEQGYQSNVLQPPFSEAVLPLILNQPSNGIFVVRKIPIFQNLRGSFGENLFRLLPALNILTPLPLGRREGSLMALANGRYAR